jgi:hypothetical protein
MNIDLLLLKWSKTLAEIDNFMENGGLFIVVPMTYSYPGCSEKGSANLSFLMS